MFVNIAHLPIALTWARIVLILPFIAFFYSDLHMMSAAILGLAALTDWLDGWCARRFQATSHFGAFLDPIADKALVITALILLTVEVQHVAMTMAALILILREILVLSLRQWSAERHGRIINVSGLGKSKTAFQLIGLIALCAATPYTASPYLLVIAMVGAASLAAATILSVISVYQYAHTIWASA